MRKNNQNGTRESRLTVETWSTIAIIVTIAGILCIISAFPVAYYVDELLALLIIGVGYAICGVGHACERTR